MANKSISALTAGGAVAATDLFPDVQTVGVGPVKVTGAQIATYVGTTIMGGTVLPANYIPYGNGTAAFSSSTNLQFNGTTLTAANDISVHGLTVGEGAGAVATNTAVGASALAANTTGANNSMLNATPLFKIISLLLPITSPPPMSWIGLWRSLFF